MIISDRFMRDNNGVFVIFNIYLDDMKKLNPSSVEIIKTGEFKEDKTISKEMETNFGMVCITLKKLEGFNIDLDNKKRIKNTINNFEKKNVNDTKKIISDLGIEKVLTKKKRKVNIDKPKTVKKPIEKKVKKPIEKKVKKQDEKRKSLLEEFRDAIRNS